jgi:hypothetical protein
MNRFERNPVLTAIALIGLLMGGLLLVTELALRPGEREARALPSKRFLAMREWLPNSSRTFKTPEARYNDPAGPVDDSYSLSIDEHGFIEPSIRHAEPDFEIAFIGGSTTECLYLRPGERFPARAGQLLEEQTGLNINAINAGRSGNHTMHSLVNTIGKIVPRRPRYAVLMHATNDIGWLSGHETYWMDKKDIGLVQERNRGTTQALRDLRDRTLPHTFRALGQGIKALKLQIAQVFSKRGKETRGQAPADNGAAKPAAAPAATPDDKEMARRKILRENYEPALRSFVRLAKAWDIKPVLMTQVLVKPGVGGAANAQGDLLGADQLARGDFDAASFSSIHAYANALIAHVAESEGALLIDLAGAGDWQPGDVYDGLHLTPTGSEKVAQLITDAISADLKAAPETAPASTPQPLHN